MYLDNGLGQESWGLDNFPTVFVLVGLPGAGKSTWRESQCRLLSALGFKVTVISSDDVVERVAALAGCSYDQAFSRVDHREIIRSLHEQCRRAVETRDTIIIDRTNLTRKARREFLCDIPPGYKKVVVVFDPSPATLAANQKARPGKTIPAEVLARMQATFTKPQQSEGFDATIVAKWAQMSASSAEAATSAVDDTSANPIPGFRVSVPKSHYRVVRVYDDNNGYEELIDGEFVCRHDGYQPGWTINGSQWVFVIECEGEWLDESGKMLTQIEPPDSVELVVDNALVNWLVGKDFVLTEYHPDEDFPEDDDRDWRVEEIQPVIAFRNGDDADLFRTFLGAEAE